MTISTHKTGERSMYQAQQSLPGPRRHGLDLIAQTGALSEKGKTLRANFWTGCRASDNDETASQAA